MEETSNNLFQMVRGICFSLIFLFLGFQSAFAKSIIKGSAPDYIGQKVGLSFTSDFISNKSQISSSDIVKEDGSFIVYSESEKVQLFKLEIGKVYSLIYLEPEIEYQVKIPEYKGIKNENLNDRYPVNLELAAPEDEKLNAHILKFNREYDTFIKEHFMLILRRGAKTRVDTFKRDVIPGFLKYQNRFYLDYVEAQLGLLDLISSHSKKQIYNDYFDSKKINYSSDAYMKFFKEFYKDFFKAFYFVDDEVRLILAVEKHASVDSLDNVLKNHAFLKNDDLRELVMIKELYFNTVNGRFKDNDTRKMLLEIKSKTQIEEHKLIIDNLLSKSDKLALGSQAPEFSLPQLNGKNLSLSSLRGKYVYLDFWATWCAPCMRSMKMMNQLYPKYRDSIEFVSISIDKNLSRAQEFQEQEQYPWIFLHFNGFEEIKEDYQVLAVPTYYLIDPKGKLIQSPAFHPESGIERYFQEITRAKTKDTQNRFWEEKPGGK